MHESRSVVFIENSFGNHIQTSNGNKIEIIDTSTSTEDLKATEIAHDDSEEDIDEAETGTRPDKAQALGSVNQFSSNPGNIHWKCVKRIMRYIKGTLDRGILFHATKETEIQLRGFTDADWEVILMDVSHTLAISLCCVVVQLVGQVRSML